MQAVRHLVYLAVLVACVAAAGWLEPVLGLRVLRRWRRLALAVLPVAVAFVGWDLAAVAAGHWTYDAGQLVGLWLPGRLPIEEVLFFLVVPVCAILGFEAVRAVLGRRARYGWAGWRTRDGGGAAEGRSSREDREDPG